MFLFEKQLFVVFPKLFYVRTFISNYYYLLKILFFIQCSIFSERRSFNYYRYGHPRTKEIALSAVLLVLAVIELFVALAASIFGCKFVCCGKEGCCQSSTKGKFSCTLKKIKWEKNHLHYSWFKLKYSLLFQFIHHYFKYYKF